MWQLGTANEVRVFSHCVSDVFGGLEIHSVSFSPDGERLASTSSPYLEVHVWDLESSERLWSHDYGGGNPGGVRATFSPDGSSLVLSLDGLVFPARSGEPLHALQLAKGSLPYVSARGQLAWSTDGGELRVFEASKPEPRLVLPFRAAREPVGK